jgi:hypothetical protein
MRPRWKILGLAGVAGVAATGVIVAQKRRAHREYDPDELRDRLHRRLAESGNDDATVTLDEPGERRTGYLRLGTTAAVLRDRYRRCHATNDP